MRSPIKLFFNTKVGQSGVSLIEMIVFIVVVSIALVALVSVYQRATATNANPLIRIRGIEAAQSRLDEILQLKYDQNTPTGGIPACGSPQPNAVACTNTLDNNLDDVDDFDGRADEPYPGYNRRVTVTTNNNIKLITVVVTTPTNERITLAVERANF